MIYKIANLLKDEISSLNIVEVAAGVALPTTVRRNISEEELAVDDIIIPVAYNDLGITCEGGELYALNPNTKKISIHWFEDLGLETNREDTYYYFARANLLLVSWWNLPLINASLRDASLLVANLIAALPTSLPNTGYLSQMQVIFDGEVPVGEEVLSKYSFDIPEDQIATYPYAITGIRIAVDFAFGKNCVDLVIVDPSVCAPKMKAESMAITEFAYSGTPPSVFNLSIYDEYGIVIDWGNNDTDEMRSGETTPVAPYTNNGTYTISFQGAKNVKTFYIQGSEFSGDFDRLKEMENVQELYVFLTSHTGDVSNVFNNPNLVEVYIWDLLSSMNLTGDMGVLSVATGLTLINIQEHPGITGNIEGFAALTALAYIDIRNAGVTGDAAQFLPYWTGMQDNAAYIDLGGTNLDYTSSTLLTWEGIFFYMDDCGLSSAELNSLLSDIATAQWSNCFILLGGSNDAPTDDTAYDILIDPAGLFNYIEVNVFGLNAGGGTDTDWLFRQPTEADLPLLWESNPGNVYTRVTGNGFTGNALRAAADTTPTIVLLCPVDADGNDVFQVGQNYQVDAMYRKKIGSANIAIFDGIGFQLLAGVDNEGAAAACNTPVFAANTTPLYIIAAGGALGDWFEIDEIVVTQI